MSLQKPGCRARDSGHTILPRDFVRDRGDVIGTLPEGQNRYSVTTEAIEQIRSQVSRSNEGRRVLVRDRDETRANAAGPVLPDPPIRSLLNHAKELRLE